MKQKIDKDGKPEVDKDGKPVMELTVEEQLAETNKRLEDMAKANETTNSELKRTQALNRQLLAKVTGGGMNVNDTVRVDDNGNELDGLDFVNDANGSTKKIIGAIVRNVQQVINGQDINRQKSEELKAQFYRNNPDLVGFEDLVGVHAAKIQAEGTYADDMNGAFKECANRVRSWLKDKGLKAPEDKTPPNLLPGSNANDKTPKPPEDNKPFDEAKAQADELADELKSRGELAGKRTSR